MSGEEVNHNFSSTSVQKCICTDDPKKVKNAFTGKFEQTFIYEVNRSENSKRIEN